uniref:Uncharacterized protein n=1 Tax=Solanum lycopersicum TaxID=4081 RepID=A0A3Q7E8H1_SOLLC|nr:testis-expressed protein 10 homolog isoform X1 [Solanum lycopersicum]XP_010315605.1 testis-expressed protein 10 homolog isoform X1 [Solanum lycopersicum]XP_025885138.1 testis-expressed protein 10 homolog isoform X1 [Solanum lycopersicum]
MVKNKAQSKKQQKRGVDFKKIRRKIGRKLPPAQNATNTEIKSKAIILPEQSIASEKAGLAVSKKGLTLKELLQQTSHHNAKVRKDALIGIRDVLLKFPSELKLHKLAVIEKLRERISDDDKLVREALYQLLKSVIFPGCKEDNKGPINSLMMTYIFNAMTHMAIEVRLMAFKFFDLLIHYFPSCFLLYAEKILQNYEDILQKNKFYLQDKGRLKNALAGLVRCLSLLPCSNQGEGDSLSYNDATRASLHAFDLDLSDKSTDLSGVVNKLTDLLPVLVSCFQDLSPSIHSMAHVDVQSFDCMSLLLQSIDLVVRFFVHASGNNQHDFQNLAPAYKKKNLSISDQSISAVTLKKIWDEFPLSSNHCLSEKDGDRYFMLNIVITEIFLHLSYGSKLSPGLLERFLEFIESSLSEKIHDGREAGKVHHEKHLISLVAFIPKLIMQVSVAWKSRILQAFTKVFENCSAESSMKLACLSVVEEMLLPEQNCLYLDPKDLEILNHSTWIGELPKLLVLLGDKHPLHSKAVLRLQLRVGQTANLSMTPAKEYENMQYFIRAFYCTYSNETVSYGPFMRLPRDIQELSVCCLYYFPFLDKVILESLASCCICHELEPFILFRVMEVLHSAYKAGHIQIADYISFFITLLSRFQVYPEKIDPMEKHEGKSNRGTFKAVVRAVCSWLSQIGDDVLVLQMLEKIVLDEISQKQPVDNIYGFIRLLITLDSKPTRLSEETINRLSEVLPEYFLDVVNNIPEEDDESTKSLIRQTRVYYLLPCFFLFDRSNMLLNQILEVMGSFIRGNVPHSKGALAKDHSSRILSVVSVLLLVLGDIKMQKLLLSCKTQIRNILESMHRLESSEDITMTIEERHKIRSAYDILTAAVSTLEYD